MSYLGVARETAENLLNAAYANRYDRSHRQEALRAVAVIEGSVGRKLSNRSKRIADDYAESVLGSRRYAPWLYVYTLVRGEFRSGWIPDNFFGRQVYQRINKPLFIATMFKSFSNVILRTDALPDLAYYIDGVIYDRDLSPISIAMLRDIVGQSSEGVYIKRDGSTRGRGVAKVQCKDLGEDLLREIGNCVIQSAIIQHPFFDQIITGSVATVRVTTVKNGDGRVGVRASYLRLGRKNTAWVMSANSVRVAVVGDDGELDSCGYTQDWRQWLCHPDTGFSFSGHCLPNFSKVAETCVALHERVPHFTIIGWDVSVDRQERVRLIEWNGGHCDIKFSEATTGPCFTGLNWESFRDLPPASFR